MSGFRMSRTIPMSGDGRDAGSHRRGAQARCTGEVHRRGAQARCTGEVHRRGAQARCTGEVHRRGVQARRTGEVHRRDAQARRLCYVTEGVGQASGLSLSGIRYRTGLVGEREAESPDPHSQAAAGNEGTREERQVILVEASLCARVILCWNQALSCRIAISSNRN